ncbi:hypothetical protein D3C84_766710 [compost metagenome]
MRVDPGIEEKVDRRPAVARLDTVGRHHPAEVVAAVVVPEIAVALVVASGAGQGERVVAADGVLHHFEHRLHVPVEKLRKQPRCRVGAAVQGAGDGLVQVQFLTAIQRASIQGDEVRALASGDVQHLHVLALADCVAAGSAGAQGELVQQFTQGFREGGQQQCRGIGPGHPQPEFAGPVLSVDRSQPGGCCDDHQQLSAGHEMPAVAGGAVVVPQGGGGRQLSGVDTALYQCLSHPTCLRAPVDQA